MRTGQVLFDGPTGLAGSSERVGAVHPRPTSTFSPMAQSPALVKVSVHYENSRMSPRRHSLKHQPGCRAEARSREAASIS